LILLGVIFFLQRLGMTSFRNWWAIFILIPAFSSFAAAISLYNRHGYFSPAVRASLVGGLFPLAVALLFLFELDWGIYWPVFIILGGFSVLSNGIRTSGDDARTVNRLARATLPWAIMTGLGAVALGSGFLMKNTGVFDPSTVLTNWWGLAILFPALGGLIASALLFQERGKLDWMVLSNLLLSVCVAVPGAVALLGLDWNLVGPIILIAAGLALIVGFQGFQREKS
jgi:hypothetical protein